VRQDAIEQSARAVQLELRSIPRSDRLRVRLGLPEVAAYPGERIPIELEVWIEEGLRDNLASYVLSAPLFGLTPGFRFIDPPVEGPKSELAVQTVDGPIRLEASRRSERLESRRFVVLTIRRIAIPLRPGRHALERASLVAQEATRWQRVLGQRRATQTRWIQTRDDAHVLVVRDVPSAGRPASYAGAVGTGFELDVRADRSVVRAGDPIALVLTLRGDGNLEGAALPPLDAPGLLPGEDFHVPAAELTGSLSQQGKRFEAVVRARHEHVREIPALEFSWFDPQTQRFETARSRPIALSVGEAQRVDADDVVSGMPAEVPEPQRPGTRRPLAVTGADLAVERRPERLIAVKRGWSGSPWAVGGGYLAGGILIGLAWFDQRRRAVDPELRAQRARLRAARREIDTGDSADVLADALRRMRAEVPGGSTPDLDAVIAACDALRFAPGRAAGTPVDSDLCARARALAATLEQAGA